LEFDNSTGHLPHWEVEVYVPPGPHQAEPVVFGFTYVHIKTAYMGWGVVEALTLTVIVTRATPYEKLLAC
jgi:hypothetical protein